MARVLVANSDPALLDTLKTVLDMAGHQVATVYAPEALEAALSLHPDAILLDLDPPDTIGVEVGMALRGDPRTATIPRIALAGRYDVVQAVEGLAFDAWLPKPFGLDQLYDTLARVAGPRQGGASAAAGDA